MLLFIVMFFGEDLRGPSYEYGINDYLELFGLAGMLLVIGGPIAYAVMVIIGLPLYLIAKKLGYINYWSVTFGASFASVFPFLVAFANKGFVVYQNPDKSSILFYLTFATVGYAVGVVFWFISGLYNLSAHNQPLKNDAGKSGAF